MREPSTGNGDGEVLLFRHTLARQSVYGTILHHNRTLLHGFAAEAYEEEISRSGERLQAVVALHYELAGRIPKAIEWGMRALEAASRSYHNEQGIEWCDKLEAWISSGQDSPDRVALLIDVLRTRAAVEGMTGSFEQRSRTVERLVRAASDHPEHHMLPNALVFRGRLAQASGRFEEAGRDLEAALSMAREAADARTEAAALGWLFASRRSEGALERAEEMIRRALELAREVDDRGLEFTLMGKLGALLFDLGRTDEAERLFRESLEIALELGDRSLIGNAVGGSVFFCWDRASWRRHERPWRNPSRPAERSAIARGRPWISRTWPLSTCRWGDWRRLSTAAIRPGRSMPRRETGCGRASRRGIWA